MSTLLWVAAPLALLGFYLLIRGRGTSRHRASVVLSLVLLAYFLATAGLGIFWVSRQQLPVFELHYVFGYLTLLLVLVHVTLHGHIVARTFFGPPRRRAGTRPTKVPRWVLQGLLLATVGVGAFTLGTRCDRQSGSAPRANTPEDADPQDVDEVRRYHEISSESRVNAFTRAPVVDWVKPPPFKSYPQDLPRVDLPPPEAPEGARPVETTAPPRSFEGTPRLDRQGVSTLLHHTGGVTLRRAGLALRASPSSGALFSAELYLVARTVDGLDPGLYHYDAEHHNLVLLSNEVLSSSQLGHPTERAMERAPATVVVTTIFARTGHKYGHRTYRYILADVGHLLENLRLTASELGFGATLLPSFDEQRVAETLSLNPAIEGALAVVPLIADGVTNHAMKGAWERSSVDASHPLGPTGRIHAGTSLRWASSEATAPGAGEVRLPASAPSTTTVWDAIRNRRSVRNYDSAPMSASELGALLSAAGRPATIVSSHVRIWTIVHRVEGVASGAYGYDKNRHSLLPVRLGDLTADTQSAVLSQEMMGRAAAVIVLTVDGRAVSSEGPRAYRHAWLEVGMLGERVYLSATARGLGACGAGAFFDDEAAALLKLERDHWVAHFVAVGRK